MTRAGRSKTSTDADMRVVFLHPTDPYVDHDAITNYIRGILKHVGGRGVFCGVVHRRKDAHSGSEAFEFVPLFSRSRKLLMPITLKYQYRLLSGRRSIPISGGVVSVHEVEWAVPLLYPRKIGPVVLTIHGASKFMPMATKSMAKIIHHELADHLAIKRADRVILVSRDAYEFYQTKYPAMGRNLVYVPTFVDDEMFRPYPDRAVLRQTRGLASDDVVLMWAGRFVLEKGLDLLLKAFGVLASVHDRMKLVLVGDGPLRGFVRDMISGGLRNVQLWGPCPHHDMPLVLNCADLLVLPSRFEATPLTVLEALACGVPVVASAVGDLPRIVVDGVNGYLVHERTASALVRAIEQCIGEPNRLSSEQCVQSVQRYRASNVVPQILEVYREAWQEARQRVRPLGGEQ